MSLALSPARCARTRSDPVVAGVSYRSGVRRASMQVGENDPTRLCLAGCRSHMGQGRDNFGVCFCSNLMIRLASVDLHHEGCLKNCI